MEFRQKGSTPLEWKTADTYLLSGRLGPRDLLAINT